MSGPSEDTAKVGQDALSAEEVSAWLRRHPDYLKETPDVLAALVPPEFDHGDGVIDMQRFMVDRLREETGALRRRERQLIAAAEGNAAGQSKIHQAVLEVIEAGDVQALNAMIRTRLPALLDIEAAALCIEEGSALSLAGARAIGDGGIAALMGPKRRILLQAHKSGEDTVFGDAANRVKSVAYIRLRTTRSGPRCLLALGSGREDGFSPEQGTDLIAFFAEALERRLTQCLAAKA